MDPNLVFDTERFVGACHLVSLIEEESGFFQQLSIPKKAKRPVNTVGREGASNIGGLGEGTLHLVLKNYISANRENQEVRVGKRIADVLLDGRIYEIQTRNFSSLKSKLSAFLPSTPVTVVFPAVREKRIVWVDPDTGELSGNRKSPKKESVYNIFGEMIYIKDHLKHPNLSFCVFELDCDEAKLLCGYSEDKKKGSVRLNRIPTKLHSVTLFEKITDFCTLLPKEQYISVKLVAKHANIPDVLARKMIYCLVKADILSYSHTQKREKYYKINI